MKNLLFLPLFLLAMAFQATAEEAESPTKKYRVYGVAFYNLENLFDTINTNGKYDLEFSPRGNREWDSEKYFKKINNLAGCIAAMTSDMTPQGPAIIGIAEVENRSVMQDLVAAEPLRGRNYQVVHHDSPDRRGVDVGLLYNPDLFTIKNVTNHRLIVPGRPDFLTRDQMCVTGELSGRRIAVIVNHWPSRLGGQYESEPLRIEAAKLSKSIADSLWRLDPSMGVIIMGDLNDDPMDSSCSEILGAGKSQQNVAPHGFYNPWWRVLEKGKGTLTYKGAWNLFDQIIVSGNLLGRNTGNLHYWKCRINDFDFIKQGPGPYQGSPWRTYAGGKFLEGYSDHFPTEIFFIENE